MSSRYVVIWRRVLIERWLASIVADAMETGESVDAFTTAMAEVDRRLTINPNDEGESRADYERYLFVAPLGITFEVHDEERIVYVLRARYVRPRR